jgi:hypothetical protein
VELKTLVLEKCVRLLRMARAIMADATTATNRSTRSVSNMDDLLSVALLPSFTTMRLLSHV